MPSVEVKPRPKLKEAFLPGELWDTIIIGGGPAGISAGIYAQRFGLKTLLIEKAALGGQASSTFLIDNYPGFPEGVSGFDLSQKFQEQVKRFGVRIIWGSVEKISSNRSHKEIVVDGKILAAKTIIIASGAESKKIGIPGEDLFRGRGVSYCGTCDGPFYKDKNILVVGGGNSAVEEALFLTRYASKVSIVHRRDKLRADKMLAAKAAMDTKIYFVWHSVVEEIIGKNKVEKVIIKDLTADKQLTIQVDGVFIYIGTLPNSFFAKGIVKINKEGYIQVNSEMKTSQKGIFAAGDVCQKTLRQVVTAVADGAIAADSARIYIES